MPKKPLKRLYRNFPIGADPSIATYQQVKFRLRRSNVDILQRIAEASGMTMNAVIAQLVDDATRKRSSPDVALLANAVADGVELMKRQLGVATWDASKESRAAVATLLRLLLQIEKNDLATTDDLRYAARTMSFMIRGE
jgi:hypothetical protein